MQNVHNLKHVYIYNDSLLTDIVDMHLLYSYIYIYIYILYQKQVQVPMSHVW